MCKNSKTASPLYSHLQIVGEMAGLLARSRIKDDNLRKILRILCHNISADAGVLFRIEYCRSETFRIETLGHWTANDDDTAMTLSAENIPDSIWKALAEKEIAQFGEVISGFPVNASKALFLPVFIGEHLSGFILLMGAELVNPTSEIDAFLMAVIGIFELWFSKMDESKKADDLLDFIPIPMLSVNTDGITTAWNTAVEEMTGWKASRVVGKGNYECSLPFYGIRRPMIVDLIMNPDPKWEATYLDYKRESDLVHSQAFIPLITGAGRFVTGITTIMRDFNGRISGSIHHIRDITHERQVESRLKSSESMFKTITDYAGLGIALFGKERALYYNERFEKLLLASGKEIDLQDLLNVVSEEEQEEVRSRLQNMFEGTEKRSLRLELQVKTESGDLHYSSYAQMLEYEGSPSICFILDDTTELKKMAEKARLNELKLYHEDRLAALGTMAAGIAHELNQPLNTIRVVTDGFFFGRKKDGLWKKRNFSTVWRWCRDRLRE